jgi:hypothetical protein
MRRLIPLVLAAVAVTGCASLDTDTVASVDGVTFSYDQLHTVMDDAGLSEGDATEVAGDAARQVTTAFVVTELLRLDLQSLEADPPQVDTASMTPSEALLAENRAVTEAWTGLPSGTLADDELRSAYEAGPNRLGWVCPAHILVATEAEADQLIADLENGADFAALAAERSVDPASADQGGFIDCFGVAQFQNDVEAAFVAAALDAQVGEPSGPVETSVGWHVVTLIPFDDIPPTLIPQLRFIDLSSRHDVQIAPAVGEWAPDAGVVPVG